MRDNVQQYCQNCLICAQDNPSPRTNKAQLRSQRSSGLWCNIQVDYMGPLSTSARNNKYILVVIDLLSKWVEAFPITNCKAKTTAKILVEQVFSRWGLPISIESDQGTHFTGEIFQEVMRMLGIKQQFHIPYRPQSSGLVERVNCQLKLMIRKFVTENQRNWDQIFPLFLMCIQVTPSTSSRFVPSKVMFGKKLRLPERLWFDLSTPQQDGIWVDKYVTELKQHLFKVAKRAAINMGKSKQKAKAYFDKHVAATEYNIGDKVMLLVFNTNSPLSHRWQGPYDILDKVSLSVYKIQLKEGKVPVDKWFHVNQMKLFKD
uniref:Integrase catalytic domain-containing protein n=1 Tax=Latimeria chalumnae TaxID=7897 RepID=H3AA81_LATCH